MAGVEALQRGDFAEAEQNLQASLRLIPDRVSTLTNLSAAQIKLKKYDLALAHARRSIEVDQQNKMGWLNLGLANFHQHQFSDALEAYDRALKIDRELAEAWTNRGTVLNSLRRHADALLRHAAD